jgi:hypothetical protein
MGHITPVVFPSFGPKLSKDRVNDKRRTLAMGRPAVFLFIPSIEVMSKQWAHKVTTLICEIDGTS